jgi:hypothetical protein
MADEEGVAEQWFLTPFSIPSRFVNFQLMLAHFRRVRQDERRTRLQTYQVNKACLFPAWSG